MRTLLALFPVLAFVADAAAQDARPYTFRLVESGDTTASEVVQRTSTEVDVDLIAKAEGIRLHFTMQVAPDESVTRITSALYRPAQDSTSPIGTTRVRFVGDSAHVEVRAAGTQSFFVPAPRGAIPWIRPSGALIEQVLRRARVLGGTTDTVPLFNITNGQTALAIVHWLAPDSAELRIAEARLLASVNEAGELQRLQMPGAAGNVVRLEGAQPLVLGSSPGPGHAGPMPVLVAANARRFMRR